jgi:hypothetical protein
VSDLTRSPWLRAGLLVLAAGLAVYGLASQWRQVQAALAELDGWDVTGPYDGTVMVLIQTV